MRALILLIAVCSVSLLSGCNRDSNLDGTYIADGSNYAVMIKIKANDDHAINGTIITAEVNEGMEVKSFNKPIAGIVEGKAVNFNIIHPAGYDPSTTPVSGITTDSGLDLTFFAKGHATSIKFRRGTAEEYHRVVDTVFQSVAEFD